MSTTLEKKTSLGRGLSALLGENLVFDHEERAIGQISFIPTVNVKAGKYQPRRYFDDEKLETLIHSIKEKGIIQPLVVRSLDEEKKTFEIIAGERRWRAAKTLGLSDVPAIIKECTDQEALETALIENVQRDDLSPIEEAEAYQRLVHEFDYTQEQLAKSIGKSRSHVANTLRLNNLPPHVKNLIHDGKLSSGHARTLINKDNIDELVDNILNNKLNVRDTEKISRKDVLEILPNEMEEQTKSLELQIMNTIGLNVSLKIKKTGGCLSIYFNSYEEIDELLDKIRGEY